MTRRPSAERRHAPAAARPASTPPAVPSPAPRRRDGLDVQRASFRALGLTDPVAIEVAVLTTTPPREFAQCAAAYRADARSGLPRTATPADVDAEAVRILQEHAGLVRSRWAAPDVAEEPA